MRYLAFPLLVVVAGASWLLVAAPSGCDPLANDPVDDGGSSGADGPSGSGPSGPPGSTGGSGDAGQGTDASKGGGDGSVGPPPSDGGASDSSFVPQDGQAGSCSPAAWTVTASVSAPNNPAGYANDGLPPTRWSSGAAQTPGQYIQIDFGGIVSVSKLVLDDSYEPGDGAPWATDFPRGVDVLPSQDGITFGASIYSLTSTSATGGQITLALPKAASVRSLRLQLNAAVSPNWWSIHEMQVTCTGGAEVDAGTPLPCSETGATWTPGAGIPTTGWTATASVTDPNSTVAGAFDGNITTRWSSGQAQAGGETFRLDLGSAQSISQVALFSQTDFPSAYALALSTDDQNYTTVATGLGAATTAICFPAQSARYVRIMQTGTGSGSWFSIYEINVFH